MSKTILLWVFIFSTNICCNRKQYICPAYNTYFIHDDKVREKMFTPFSQDSAGSNQSITNYSPDSTAYLVKNEGETTTGKMQPKSVEVKTGKKFQPNGLVINTSGKKKPRNITDIEMITIMVKPDAKFSGMDSTNQNIATDSGIVAPSDTL